MNPARLIAAASFILLAIPRCGLPQDSPQLPKMRIETLIDSPSICRPLATPATLKLQTLVLNEGGTDVIVTSNRLSTTVGIIALIDTSQMTFRAEAIEKIADRIGPAPTPVGSTVRAGGFLRVPFQVSLDDEIFRTDGYYLLHVATSVPLGSGDSLSGSTSILFQLSSCK